MIVYKNKFEHPIIIDQGMLVKISYSGDSSSFGMTNIGTELGGGAYHQFNDSDIQRLVWGDGSSTYKFRINSKSDGTILHTPTSSVLKQNLRMEFFIKQYHPWGDAIGMILVVKGTNGNIYASKFLKITDFQISKNLFTYYGSYWAESHIIDMPAPDDEDLVVTYRVVTAADVSDNTVSSYMKINNYPDDISSYTPIRQEKPMPDYIDMNVSIDSKGYVILAPFTLEKSTLQESIKKYMGFEQDDIINIRIYYTVWATGTNQKTGLIENNIIRISNEENYFDPIRYAIYVDEWIDQSNPAQLFKIDVMMDIEIDGKHMYRTKSINADFSSPILRNHVSAPTSVEFKEVVDKIEVNQTVINQPTDVKIVKVNQPVFIRFIEQNITSFDQNITIESIIEPSYMIVEGRKGSQSISSQITSDNKHYFDLTKFDKSNIGNTYKIYNTRTNKLIGEGKIIL